MDLLKIKAFAFDIDGVMTDGGILCDLEGQLYRNFDAKDGFAVRMATMNGYPVAVITGGRSGSIRQRFLSCGVPAEDIYLGSRDKIAVSEPAPPMRSMRSRPSPTGYRAGRAARAASGNASKKR